MADYLEDMDMRQPIRTKSAPVDLNVLQPLDVRQRVAGHLTLKRHVAAHHCGAVSRQAGLQDRPVEGGLCHNTKTRSSETDISTADISKSEHPHTKANDGTGQRENSEF